MPGAAVPPRLQRTGVSPGVPGHMSAATCAILAALAGAVSAQPAFPDGVEPIMDSVAARQRAAIAPGADEQPVLQRLKGAAAARLEGELAEAFASEQLQEDIGRLAWRAV